MKSTFDFVIEPFGERYNNSTKIGDKNLILNTEVFNHQFINRIGIVKSTPLAFNTAIKEGDLVIVHHNVFRRWHDVKGRERNSRSFFRENKYLLQLDQVYAYKQRGSKEWKALEGFTFVRPVKNTNKYNIGHEQPLVGIVEYSSVWNKGDVVGFTPGDEFEFVIDNTKLYRVMDQYIAIKYEDKRDKEAYNPSWA